MKCNGQGDEGDGSGESGESDGALVGEEQGYLEEPNNCKSELGPVTTDKIEWPVNEHINHHNITLGDHDPRFWLSGGCNVRLAVARTNDVAFSRCIHIL